LVALSADDSSGYTLRGIVAEREQKYDEAVRWHRLAVARAPTNVDSLIALGVALQSAGRQQESLEVLGKAIKLDPQSALARKAFAGAVVE
jgi:Flp pilus assembly protein TadD